MMHLYDEELLLLHSRYKESSNMLTSLVFFVLILVMVYVWKKRWLYYHSLQFPGPFTLPFVMTSFRLVTALHKDPYETLVQLCESYPPIFKFWMANDLYIVNSQPEDLEVLLNTFLDKNRLYKMWDDFAGSTLITSPVAVWKERRREASRSFKQNIIASFHDNFHNCAKQMVKFLDESCGQVQTDLLPEIWKCNIDTAVETLIGIDPASIGNLHEAIALVIRAEEIMVKRFKKFWLLSNFIFRFSHLRKEVESIAKVCRSIGEQGFMIKKQQMEAGVADELGSKRFSNHMINFCDQSNTITETELIQESVVMMVAASETTSLVTNFVIVVLGLFPEIQDNIYDEICSLSLENVSRMNYLERVIKETMRLFPVGSHIFRKIDKDVKVDQFVYPAGSNLMIPIGHIHRRPDLWPNPLEFDPDRFLPEEVAKRHRCAYIPFSFGSRNCIGLAYAMLSMKVMLAHIVKDFKIKAVNYRSLDDIEVEWHFLCKPKGCRVMFERRT